MTIKDWNSRKSQSFTFGRSSSSISSSRKEKSQNYQQQCIKLCQRYHHHHHDENGDHDNQNQESRWKVLWRKIIRGKRRIFLKSNHNCSAIAAYDPQAYLRNFDDGMECREPDSLTRTFSARFADPSRMVNQNRLFS